MPDDLDDLINAEGPGGKDCAVGWWLTHGHADADRLAAAVANPSAPLGDVAAAFIRRGMDVTAQAVSRHRRGVCRCPR